MISFFLRTVLLPPCCCVSYPVLHGFVGLYRLCKIKRVGYMCRHCRPQYILHMAHAIWHLSSLFTIIPATYYVANNFIAPGTKIVSYSQFSNF